MTAAARSTTLARRDTSASTTAIGHHTLVIAEASDRPACKFPNPANRSASRGASGVVRSFRASATTVPKPTSAPMLIYPGVAGDKLFASDAIEVAVAMPAKPELVQVVDLNNDGKQDLLLRHEVQGKPFRIEILIAD